MYKYKPDRKNTVLLVLDMQEKSAELMDEDMLETTLRNISILSKSFHIMGLPVIETLQSPREFGNLREELRGVLEPQLTIEKTAFSAYAEEKIINFLKDSAIKTVVLTGMEAHISVLQTALDLLEAGFNVHIAADAVISQNDFNWETGLDMMQNAGAVISVAETIIYQLIGDSITKEFKDISRLFQQ